MWDLLLAALADPGTWVFVALGFAAQLCDGALGMGFGAISSAVLAALGVPRDVASASVNGAKIFTGAASSAAHLLHRNVDGRMLALLALAGGAGGLLGALVLVRWSHGLLGVAGSLGLIVLGVFVIRRGLRDAAVTQRPRRLSWVGSAGGMTEALFGVWGPLVTSSLVALGVHPRYAVGTSSVAETFVAMAVFGALAGHLGLASLSVTMIGLVLGALFAAPLAARLARDVPRRVLAVAVGVLVCTLGAIRLWRDLAPV